MSNASEIKGLGKAPIETINRVYDPEKSVDDISPSERALALELLEAEGFREFAGSVAASGADAKGRTLENLAQQAQAESLKVSSNPQNFFVGPNTILEAGIGIWGPKED